MKRSWTNSIFCFLIGAEWFLFIPRRATSSQSQVIIEPKNFKVDIPFQYDIRGMLIETRWGKGHVVHNLLWDNHSPTWANESVVSGNPSVSRSRDFSYRTTTADGAAITGDVYVCDNIDVGGVQCKKVPFYKISNPLAGVLGENIISNGIWQIDFWSQRLTFTSSLDSLNDIGGMIALPAKFSDDAILIPVSFRNHVFKYVELDFGFNGGIILPFDNFTEVVRGNNQMYRDTILFTTPAHSSAVETTHASDTVSVNGKPFHTIISTNRLNRETLIGLGFFSRFKSVIIDYIGKRIYLKEKTTR